MPPKKRSKGIVKTKDVLHKNAKLSYYRLPKGFSPSSVKSFVRAKLRNKTKPKAMSLVARAAISRDSDDGDGEVRSYKTVTLPGPYTICKVEEVEPMLAAMDAYMMVGSEGRGYTILGPKDRGGGLMLALLYERSEPVKKRPSKKSKKRRSKK